jgi:hypothetical protein
MKKAILCLALVGLVGVSMPASATICAIDDVPAATLLLPYFAVDLADDAGVNTLFSINNASATSQIAHVTIWSEFSVPIIDFDVYLTGFDVQTISLRDIIRDGVLPQTGPSNAISPVGDFSAGHPGGTLCGTTAGTPPVYGPIGPQFLANIQAALTGEPIPFGLAAGECAAETGANPDLARGYVTIDDVNFCNQVFPDEPEYYAGVIDFDNVLWGDYFYVESGENFAQGETLVHVEATDDTAAVLGWFAAGNGTFYGRYTPVGADRREPLPNTYGARYAVGGGFDGGTEYLIYRQPPFPGDFAAACGTGPGAWAGEPGTANRELTTAQVVCFDEEENPLVASGGPSGGPEEAIRIPWEVNVLDPTVDFGTPDNFGWCYMNLALDAAIQPQAQAWVTVRMSAEGRYSVGFDAVQLNNSCISTSGGFLPSLL